MDGALSALNALYGAQAGLAVRDRLRALVERYRPLIPAPRSHWLTERDVILITYGDQVRRPGVPHLQTLADFGTRWIASLIPGMHILPFYASSSDDGFSVVDYRAVDPELGSWADVARLGEHFRLMFDAVVNHVSAQSAWFQGFLRDDPRYRGYFISVSGDPDLSRVVRPRALPLLTRFATPSGGKAVWTTFSEDQVDLNYRNPDVLLQMIDVLLFYFARGAEFIRLDAVAYLWKETGTACIHLPQTHAIVRVFRAVLDEVAPYVRLVTETNVPHGDNVTYFGDGANEAQLVYNFALPPLVLCAFHSGNARALTAWAANLTLPSERTAFFNFLASHDGIGLNPARGILQEAEIDALVARVRARGGLVSYKRSADGTRSAYELNVNYFDALSDPHGGEPLEIRVDRFAAAHAIMLALAGVPGIYFHSLFGSLGWPEGVQLTGRNRTINREKLGLERLERELCDPASLRYRVFHRLAHLLRVRAMTPAFAPGAAQTVVDLGDEVFGVWRRPAGGAPGVLCVHNVSARRQRLAPAAGAFGLRDPVDLLSGERVPAHAALGPYQVLWMMQNA